MLVYFSKTDCLFEKLFPSLTINRDQITQDFA